MCVYEMGNLRVIDLSKILDPATETRRCHLFRFNTGCLLYTSPSPRDRG